MNKTQFLAGCLLAALAFAPAACVGTKTSSAADPSNPAGSMTEPKGVQVASVAEDPNDPTICKKEADSTSRIRRHKQKCMKKSEWEQKAKDDRDDFEDTRNIQINPGGGGN